jgi:hypothetical protein
MNVHHMLDRSRFWRVLITVYNARNYWLFGLHPSCGTLEARKLDFLEAGSVSMPRSDGGDTYSVGSHGES